MNSYRTGLAFVLAWSLVISLVVPVSAEGMDSPPSDDMRGNNPYCAQSVFRVTGDADVNFGSIVDGPYSGFPIVVVSDPGQGLPLNTTTPIPTTVIPFVPALTRSPVFLGNNVGLGVNVPPVPALARFPIAQRVLSSGTLSVQRGTLILLARPTTITLAGCV